jgi:DNA-binding transcriptional ArsR family regulator
MTMGKVTPISTKVTDLEASLELRAQLKIAVSQGAHGFDWMEPDAREAVIRGIEEYLGLPFPPSTVAAWQAQNQLLEPLVALIVAASETPLEESTARQARKQAHVVPDIEYIRKLLPIQDVARELGLSINGRQAHCWRLEAHRNGDRKPSIWFNKKNRARCEVCDSRPLSTIDLVMLVKHVDVATAVNWIAGRFSVPNVPKGKHLKSSQRWRPTFRVGTGDDLVENIVRSGVLADLDGAVVKVLMALIAFSDREGCAEISNRGLMQYAGVSQDTVTRAITVLKKLHLLEVEKKGSLLREQCSRYRLTVDDPKFLATAEDRARQTHELIATQRSQRAVRRRVLRSSKFYDQRGGTIQ